MKNFLNRMIAAIGVAFIVIGGMTSANATEVRDSGEGTINVGASADSIDDCNWYFSGVGNETNSLTLTNPDGDDYVGSELPLTGTDDGLNVFLSGSDTPGTDCSFYGEVLGVGVNVTWLDDGFEADGLDDNLDWTLVQSPLTLTVDDSLFCSDWTKAVVDLDVVGTLAETEIPLSISNAAVGEYDPVTSLEFPSCSFDIDYSTSIPSGRVPDDGGSSFTFTGPAVTLTLVINSGPS